MDPPGLQKSKMNKTTMETELSESALAAAEFATWVRRNPSQLKIRELYEIRPCKRVRGYMLRLPGIGWKLWFPSVLDAVSFSHRAAKVYAAECLVYDAAGQVVA